MRPFLFFLFGLLFTVVSAIPNARADGFASPRLIVEESASEQAILIDVTAPTGSIIAVSSAGSADLDADYRLSTNTLTFSDTHAALTLTILPDTEAEGPESFCITLTNTTGEALAIHELHVLLRDDDSFSIAAANISSQTSLTHTCYSVAAGRIFEGMAADVAAIQEFNVTNNGDYTSRRAFVDTHFGTNFHFCVESNSLMPNGVISRWPIQEWGIWDDAELPDREFIWATLQIPGDHLLHVVSVHVKAGSTDDVVARRIHEARQLTNYIATAFSPTNFIALCGDFNLNDRAESSLHILTNHFPYTYTPKDQYGYKNSSRNRSNPYDWVMANPLLNAHTLTTRIHGISFPEGAIFDSRLWSPPPYPVQTNDSQEIGMQHMPVIRMFSFTETSAPPGVTTLAAYTFDGPSAGTNAAALTQTGITASAFTTDDGSFSYLTGETGGHAIRDSGWDGELASHYFTFTINVASGYRALLSSLQFNGLRGSTGPTRWSVRSSLDGFTNDLAAGEAPLADAWSTGFLSLGLDLLSGEITFRIYGYEADSSSGNWRIDNVSLLGTLTKVEVLQLRAVALDQSVMLRWTLPTACGMPNNNVLIVHNTTHYPTNTSDGVAIEVTNGATSLLHTNCETGVTRYYTLWVHDGDGYVTPAD